MHIRYNNTPLLKKYRTLYDKNTYKQKIKTTHKV